MILKYLKRKFNLFSMGDIEAAFQNCGHASDRQDLEWKVKRYLLEILLNRITHKPNPQKEDVK